jgi:hypothetical protein
MRRATENRIHTANFRRSEHRRGDYQVGVDA